MQIQITFKDNIKHSLAVEERISEKVEKLEHIFDRILGCKVVVEQVQKHQKQGKLYNISICLFVPGKELAVSRHPHENLYLALQSAIDGMRVQLEEYRERYYHDVKDHGFRLTGEIARLFDEELYGFIVDEEENEYYFNLSHLVDIKFDQLRQGEKVRFIPAMGNEGPQARRVTVSK